MEVAALILSLLALVMSIVSVILVLSKKVRVVESDMDLSTKAKVKFNLRDFEDEGEE